MKQEEIYILKRIWKSKIQSILFYLFRIFPIKENKIVFCCIEGTAGYICNPKYIAKELLRINNGSGKVKRKYELVWLVNDGKKKFPHGIKVVHNSLWNRAYHLTTARFWIDNSRKQLEVRKRRNQIYIQTWHAKIGFKPTCFDRGTSFSRIAYLVSKHDSDMIDYVLSNSDWYDNTLPRGMIYEGPILKTGSPRCDILVKSRDNVVFRNAIKKKLVEESGVQMLKDSDLEQIHFLLYAPTFRGGSQSTDRKIEVNQGVPDYKKVVQNLEKRFGGHWIILLRLHPQLVVRNLDSTIVKEAFSRERKNRKIRKINEFVIDVSRVDDMYFILSGCDAFMTDYSSAAFDASVMEIPIFLYCNDYEEYEAERGKLLWNLKDLPFAFAKNDEELENKIQNFDKENYRKELLRFFKETGMVEDGNAAKHVVDFLRYGKNEF